MQAAARGAGGNWAEQFARVSDLQLAVDESERKRRKQEESIDEHLIRLGAATAQTKPVEWYPKKIRRAAEAGDEKARKRAEQQEREKWAKRIFDHLVESGTPFGKEAAAKGWRPGSPEASRILAGLRTATLRKRYSDYQPFVRWLRDHFDLIPLEPNHVLA